VINELNEKLSNQRQQYLWTRPPQLETDRKLKSHQRPVTLAIANRCTEKLKT